MPERLPLSVFIIAKDEEDRIPRAIESVRDWADEVIVVDGGSGDGTVAVCEALGARVYFHAWRGYGPQKAHAETLCRNRWLLNIDADEEVTPELAAEIRRLFAGEGPALPAYRVTVAMRMRFARVHHRLAPNNSPIRLYDRERAGFRDHPIHDSVVFHDGREGKVGRLRHVAWHRSFRSYPHAIDKLNLYSTMQAQDLLRKGKVPSGARLVTEPFFAFFKMYLLRRYFLYGVEGWTEAVIYAFWRTMRLAKAREMARGERGPAAPE